MPALSIYSNVENTALVILDSKGYRVWKDASTNLLMAEKEGWDFCGESAVELLAAASIFEYHSPKEFKEYWWRIEAPDLLNDIPTAKPNFDSVVKGKRK